LTGLFERKPTMMSLDSIPETLPAVPGWMQWGAFGLLGLLMAGLIRWIPELLKTQDTRFDMLLKNSQAESDKARTDFREEVSEERKVCERRHTDLLMRLEAMGRDIVTIRDKVDP
jgi:hypothetical protein